MKIQKLLVVLTLVILAGCAVPIETPVAGTTPKETDVAVAMGGQEISHNVFDNGRGTAYFQADDLYQTDAVKNLVDLMAKVENWKLMFPQRRIVTWLGVPGNTGNYGRTVFVGIWAQYEQR